MNTKLNDLFSLALGRLPGLNKTFSMGLELGPNRLNLVQMERLKGLPHLRAIASVPHKFGISDLYQNPKKLRDSLKLAFSTQPFRGKRVVSCLPADQVKIITVSYRSAESQPDSVPIVAELRERLKGELDNMVVDFMPLRDEEAGSGKRDALVALAPRDKVVAYLELLASAGLEVDALDIGPAALARLVSQAGALHTPGFPNLPNVLLVNFGADCSYLTVIWGRRLMLDRAVDFSENQLLGRLNQVLDMSADLAARLLYETPRPSSVGASGPDEMGQMVAEVLRPEINQLLQEINKTLIYMASKTRGKSVDHVYLAGKVANYPGLLDTLEEQLHVPVKKLDPVAMFASRTNLFPANLGTAAGMALTAGLALRGVQDHE